MWSIGHYEIGDAFIVSLLVFGYTITLSGRFCVWDTDSYKSEDFLLNPICILYIIVCLSLLCMYKVYK